ncbi:J domain-containing protein [Oricola cellulosilytica]|uniref:DnaJ family molecular chaperone n=1 Tax=Oricola cellulosilytica TaxID=1429082 RepID=A0A4R0PCU9_9HYPH|nr:DnaJ family molecular chaperone [Oricola cellulosilytica]TCD14363.1 DnaJ family molecular chaperone [Oricola cellulosilytica]
MSIWVRISDFVADRATTALSGLVESVRTVFAGDPATRRRVAFSIAMIALSAKMAKADGIVTVDEVDAFREIFEIPADDARRVAGLYNLAKQDVAGYEAYARQVAGLCGSGKADCPLLIDVLDGLFHIAKADGVVHAKELHFLTEVAEIFGVSSTEFERVVARHVDAGHRDPYRILGLDRGVSHGEGRRRYLKLVRDNHPDQLIARGLPEEFVKIANDRIAAINDSWELIEPELRRG